MNKTATAVDAKSEDNTQAKNMDTVGFRCVEGYFCDVMVDYAII